MNQVATAPKCDNCGRPAVPAIQVIWMDTGVEWEQTYCWHCYGEDVDAKSDDEETDE